MAHPNEDLVRRGYDAFAKGDLEALRGLLADDIVWHSPGRSPLSGDFRGIDEVLAFLGRVVETSGGTVKLEIHDLMANDEHGIALVRTTGQRDGKTLDDRGAQVLHLEDGKITEFWGHPGDQYAVDEFWS